jgi:hypothetical protein
MSISEDNIYRVSVSPTTQHVDVMCFGMNAIDAEADGRYVDINALPQWIREKIALLMMTSDKPPTEPVEGVGVRINSYTYWVYHD